MAKRIPWILMSILAVSIGLYPAIYFIIDRHFGLLSSKSIDLLTSPFWNAGFYTHIVLGGVALLMGWPQFNSTLRNKYLHTHRLMGKVYVIAALLSSTAGFGIAFYATGGIVASLGFLCLAVTWFYSTLKAYLHIRHHQQLQHQKMMIYSYAACFAAVTLRIWLPLLSSMLGDFTTAYRIVAWLCWIPNMIVANLIVSQLIPTPTDASTAPGNFV